MKQSLDLASLSKSISSFFTRFHSILFFLIIGAGIVICMFTVISVVTLSGDSDASTETIDQSFDTKTIDRIKQLETRGDTSTIALPKNQRTNPFVD